MPHLGVRRARRLAQLERACLALAGGAIFLTEPMTLGAVLAAATDHAGVSSTP